MVCTCFVYIMCSSLIQTEIWLALWLHGTGMELHQLEINTIAALDDGDE